MNVMHDKDDNIMDILDTGGIKYLKNKTNEIN